MRLLMCLVMATACSGASHETSVKPTEAATPVEPPKSATPPPAATRQLVKMNARWVTTKGAISQQIAVELEPIKGWHIYWHNPGDSGLPTSFAVRQGSRELAHTVRMPSPKRSVSAGSIVSYGFEGPTLFFVAPQGQDAALGLEVESVWLACAETCVKGSKMIRLDAFSRADSKAREHELQAWNALPTVGNLSWVRTATTLRFEASQDAELELYPHAELHRRLDGHSLSYCTKNRCELPLQVVDSTPSKDPLWATLTLSTSRSKKSFETQINKGISP